MSVIYRTSLKTSRMQAVADDIDSGSGPGTIEIGTAAMASILAILTLSDPCGTVSTDTLTFSAITSDTSADNTGTAAAAQIKNSTGTVIVSGLTVGTSGANINLNSVAIAAGQIVALTSGTITHG